MSKHLPLIRILIGLLLTVGLTGCGGSSNEETENFPAPSIDFECDPYQAISCTQTAHQSSVFIGLSHNSNADCEQSLSNFGLPLHQQFDYSGWTRTNWNGSYLTGAVNTWTNQLGSNAPFMAEGTYVICGFIDLNSNQRLDIAEPIVQEPFYVGKGFYPLSQWYTF